MNEPQLHSTLAQARTWWDAQASAKGARCPCCDRFGKRYRRLLTNPMVMCLVEIYRHRHRKGDFIDCKKALPHVRGGDYGKLRFWGFIEQRANENGSTKDSGFWRITLAGKDFLKHGRRVPKYAVVYDNELIRLEGPEVTLVQCLKADFDYSVLMDDEVEPLQPGDNPQLDLLGA